MWLQLHCAFWPTTWLAKSERPILLWRLHRPKPPDWPLKLTDLLQGHRAVGLQSKPPALSSLAPLPPRAPSSDADPPQLMEKRFFARRFPAMGTRNPSGSMTVPVIVTVVFESNEPPAEPRQISTPGSAL